MKLFAALALTACMTVMGCAEQASAPSPEVIQASNRVEANIDGLHCMGCVGEVCSAVEQVAGVTGATADLKTGQVTVALADDTDADAAMAEVEKVIAGIQDGKYTVKTISTVTPESESDEPEAESPAVDEAEAAETQADAGSDETVYTTSYNITGMTCTACSDKVTKAVAAIDGVESVSVCHMSGKASYVAAEGAEVCPVSVAKAIEATGFEAVKNEVCDSECKTECETKCETECDIKNKSASEAKPQADAGSDETVYTTSYNITGMTCTACSDKVTKAVAAIEGVESVKVCHMSGKASYVATEGAHVCPVSVAKAIEATGFKVAKQ